MLRVVVINFLEETILVLAVLAQARFRASLISFETAALIIGTFCLLTATSHHLYGNFRRR